MKEDFKAILHKFPFFDSEIPDALNEGRQSCRQIGFCPFVFREPKDWKLKYLNFFHPMILICCYLDPITSKYGDPMVSIVTNFISIVSLGIDLGCFFFFFFGNLLAAREFFVIQGQGRKVQLRGDLSGACSLLQKGFGDQEQKKNTCTRASCLLRWKCLPLQNMCLLQKMRLHFRPMKFSYAHVQKSARAALQTGRPFTRT